jgi:CHAT domain-containing protein
MWRHRWQWLPSFALLGGCGTLLVLLTAHTDASHAIAGLSNAMGPLPYHAWLTGARSPAAAVPGGASPGQATLAARQAIRTSSQQSASRDDSRIRAAVDLYRGEADSAVETLEGALRLRSRDPYLLNDLSAAHLVAAANAPDAAAQHLTRAIERAVAAADLRPDWPEPGHNRQAALDALGIGRWSAESWVAPIRPTAEEILGLDSRAHHLLAVTESQGVRELMERDLPVRWAEAYLAGRPTADRYLAAFGQLARARAAVHRDPLLAESVAAVERATGETRRLLARAHLAYARGRSLYDAGQREAALDELTRAHVDFAAAGSSFQHEARIQVAVATYQLRQVDAALAEAETLQALASTRGYRSLSARADWITALARMQKGAIEDAVDAHERARELYEDLGEFNNAASVANSEADTLRISGDTVRGWQVLTRAARHFSSLDTPQRQYLLLFNLSLYAQEEGLWRAAEIFQTAAVRAADRRGVALTMIESRLRRAELLLRRSSHSAARQDLDAARTLLDRVRSSTSHAYLTAWLDRVGARLLLRQDPLKASTALEALVRRFQSTEPAEIPRLYLEASGAARLGGDASRAAALLRLGIAFTQVRRALLNAPEYRLMHASAVWDLHHDLIALELRTDPLAALRTADEGHTALEAFGATTASPRFDLMSLRRSLPGDTAILYYAVLRNGVGLWVITRDEISVRQIPYAPDSLAADVDAYRRALEHADEKQASIQARTLFARLLTPALGLTHAARRLLIAPDGPLADIPYAALVDPLSGRFLVQEYEIAYVSSVAALTAAIPQQAVRALAIGHNGMPGDRWPLLQNAENEARMVAGLYPEGVVLTGANAASRHVADSIAGHDVVHIAAHAEANRLAPWNSPLWLAPPEGSRASSVARPETVVTWDLRRCQVVVLSACETATGSRLRGLGIVSMTGPFLSAGASAVVGTLWRIDDRATVPLMRVFHRQIVEGRRPSAALRAAQLDALDSNDPSLRAMSHWSAWVVHTRTVPTAGSGT